MDELLLDPAGGDPPAIIIGILAELLEGLCEFQLQVGRRIGMAAGIRQIQSDISDVVRAEVQAEIVSLAQGQVMHTVQDDILDL